jgi:hypothetical protein
MRKRQRSCAAHLRSHGLGLRFAPGSDVVAANQKISALAGAGRAHGAYCSRPDAAKRFEAEPPRQRDPTSWRRAAFTLSIWRLRISVSSLLSILKSSRAVFRSVTKT